MKHETAERIRQLYRGERGSAWERIETGRPATYLEENAVEGRKEVQARLLDWLQPLDGLRVLDGGCGLGTFAGRLAEAGASAVGVDLCERFLAGRDRAAGGAELLEGNFLDRLGPDGPEPRPDALVLMEVLEDYDTDERRELLLRVALGGVARVYLVFRRGGRDSGRLWRMLSPDPREAIDPVTLLRWVHTSTPYRQRRQHIVRRRNYEVHLSELVADPD